MVGLNIREKDTSRAYRIIESRLAALEAIPIVQTGSLTLTDSSATSSITADSVVAGDLVFLAPTSATAATAMTAVYVSSVSAGAFELTHDSTADTDRTFDWVAIRPA